MSSNVDDSFAEPDNPVGSPWEDDEVYKTSQLALHPFDTSYIAIQVEDLLNWPKIVKRRQK